MEILGDRKDFVYTSCYCEENVWKFLKECLDKNDRDDLYAIFISNKNRTVPVWSQKSSKDVKYPVVWDYHVIAIHKNSTNKTSHVYDFDTILKFPEPFETYSGNSLPDMSHLPLEYERLYRVIPAKYFIENFASNRSHMIDKKTGKYQSEPPKYPCIRTETNENNIQEFIEMDLEQGVDELKTHHGTIMRQEKFFKFFTE